MKALNSPDCTLCLDDGHYFDSVCLKDSCAHGGRKRSRKEMKALRKAAEPGEHVDTHTGRVMPCPSRPCACQAGTLARTIQKRQIEKQERRLSGKS